MQAVSCSIRARKLDQSATQIQYLDARASHAVINIPQKAACSLFVPIGPLLDLVNKA